MINITREYLKNRYGYITNYLIRKISIDHKLYCQAHFDYDLAGIYQAKWNISHIQSIIHSEFFRYRKDRKRCKGGDLAVVVRKNICYKLLPGINTELIENLSIKIKLVDNNNVTITILFYFPMVIRVPLT